LLGLGCAAAFVAPLALYARRFPADRFATLVGLQLGLGTGGTLLATAPLAYSAAEFGWRATFLGVGVVTLLAGLLIAVVVKDERPAEGVPRESLSEAVAGVLAVFRTPSVGRLFLLSLTGYSTFALVVGLWGGPYLTHVYGYSLQERGALLLLPALAQIIGALAWGPTDRLLGSYKRPVLIGALSTCAALAVVAAVGKFSPAGLIVWLVAFGFLSAYLPVSIAHGKSLFPPHLVGRGITLLNMGSMGGVFLSQAITGALIDIFPAESGVYPLDAYRIVFAFQAAMLLVSCAIYVGSRDPRRLPSL
jgi:MFS family permease